MTAIEELRNFLTGPMDIGDPGTTFFLMDQNLPSDMNTVLYSLWPTGGRFGILTHDNKKVSEPWFQLVIRHGRGTDAIRAAEAAHRKLFDANVRNVTQGDKFFLTISPTTPPLALSADASQRARMAFNIATIVRDITP